jgi:catechol 2,3-dioxygenase-like lactoylglutathione lyase family enzyme
MATRKPGKPTSRARKSAARPVRPAKKATAKRAVKTQRPPRRQPETLRLRSFEPSFTVNDLGESIRFYTELLGFVISERWDDDAGVLRGVMLKAGDCELGLAQDDWAKGRDRKKGEAVRIWCQTAQDIDAIAARIKAGGGRLTEEPHDQWGSRSLSVDDPDGFHLTIYREK